MSHVSLQGAVQFVVFGLQQVPDPYIHQPLSSTGNWGCCISLTWINSFLRTAAFGTILLCSSIVDLKSNLLSVCFRSWDTVCTFVLLFFLSPLRSEKT